MRFLVWLTAWVIVLPALGSDGSIKDPPRAPASDVISSILKSRIEKVHAQCTLALESINEGTLEPPKKALVMNVIQSHLQEISWPFDRILLNNARQIDDENLKQLSATGRKDVATILEKYLHIEDFVAGQELEALDPQLLERRDKLKALKKNADWTSIVQYYDSLTKEQKEDSFSRETLALALNKRGKGRDRARAIDVLQTLIQEAGGTGERYGLLGSVYKSLWKQHEGETYFDKAIEAYMNGFKADQDYYPATAMLSMLYERGRAEDLQQVQENIVIIHFLLQVRPKETRNYWDYVSLVELDMASFKWNEVNQLWSDFSKYQADLWALQSTYNDWRQLEGTWERFVSQGLMKQTDLDKLREINNSLERKIQDVQEHNNQILNGQILNQAGSS